MKAEKINNHQIAKAFEIVGVNFDIPVEYITFEYFLKKFLKDKILLVISMLLFLLATFISFSEYNKILFLIMSLMLTLVFIYEYKEFSSDYGSYDPNTGKICVNIHNIPNEVNLLFVLLHEYRHHVQFTKEYDFYGSEFESYVSPKKNFTRYSEQFIERDANNFALNLFDKHIKELSDLFQRELSVDPMYREK